MRVSMDMNNPTQPARRKDGSLKYYMQVPLQVNSAFFPEGRVRWIVQGQAQGELSRAMERSRLSAGDRGARVRRRDHRHQGGPAGDQEHEPAGSLPGRSTGARPARPRASR